MEQRVKKATTLLEEKKQLFEEYETLTNSLTQAVDIIDMEDYITKRGELANKIDKLDDIIKKLVLEDFGEQGKLALVQSSPREALPQELWPIYDSNMAILDIVRRIRLHNTDITADYHRLRDEMTQKIKQSSNMPKINRYLVNLATPDEVNNFGSV